MKIAKATAFTRWKSLCKVVLKLLEGRANGTSPLGDDSRNRQSYSRGSYLNWIVLPVITLTQTETKPTTTLRATFKQQSETRLPVRRERFHTRT